MKTVRIRLESLHLEEMDKIIKEKGISRDQYINQALSFYNQYHKRKKLSKSFEMATKLVSESSMTSNSELDQLIDEGLD